MFSASDASRAALLSILFCVPFEAYAVSCASLPLDYHEIVRGTDRTTGSGNATSTAIPGSSLASPSAASTTAPPTTHRQSCKASCQYSSISSIQASWSQTITPLTVGTVIYFIGPNNGSHNGTNTTLSSTTKFETELVVSNVTYSSQGWLTNGSFTYTPLPSTTNNWNVTYNDNFTMTNIVYPTNWGYLQPNITWWGQFPYGPANTTTCESWNPLTTTTTTLTETIKTAGSSEPAYYTDTVVSQIPWPVSPAPTPSTTVGPVDPTDQYGALYGLVVSTYWLAGASAVSALPGNPLLDRVFDICNPAIEAPYTVGDGQIHLGVEVTTTVNLLTTSYSYISASSTSSSFTLKQFPAVAGGPLAGSVSSTAAASSSTAQAESDNEPGLGSISSGAAPSATPSDYLASTPPAPGSSAPAASSSVTSSCNIGCLVAGALGMSKSTSVSVALTTAAQAPSSAGSSGGFFSPYPSSAAPSTPNAAPAAANTASSPFSPSAPVQGNGVAYSPASQAPGSYNIYPTAVTTVLPSVTTTISGHFTVLSDVSTTVPVVAVSAPGGSINNVVVIGSSTSTLAPGGSNPYPTAITTVLSSLTTTINGHSTVLSDVTITLPVVPVSVPGGSTAEVVVIGSSTSTLPRAAEYETTFLGYSTVLSDYTTTISGHQTVLSALTTTIPEIATTDSNGHSETVVIIGSSTTTLPTAVPITETVSGHEIVVAGYSTVLSDFVTVISGKTTVLSALTTTVPEIATTASHGVSETVLLIGSSTVTLGASSSGSQRVGTTSTPASLAGAQTTSAAGSASSTSSAKRLGLRGHRVGILATALGVCLLVNVCI